MNKQNAILLLAIGVLIGFGANHFLHRPETTTNKTTPSIVIEKNIEVEPVKTIDDSTSENKTSNRSNTPTLSDTTHDEGIAITTNTETIPVLTYGNASITTDNNYRYINSNGIPEHATGQFPNAGNPNAISEQDHNFRVTLNPVKTSNSTELRVLGVALNGLPLEPGTAETYNNDINWAIEAFNANGDGILGIDWSNAHVQPTGSYHYHGTPHGLLETALKEQSGDLIQLAWAADGFPMYYSQSNAFTSSWQLKSGTRPDGPGGSYDGTYAQDWEYVSGSGDLDQCNGIIVGDSYAYLITDQYPYIQRCVMGTPDDSFSQRPRGPGAGPGQATPGNQPQEGNTPPQEAITACSGLPANSSCTVKTPRGDLNGTCRNAPGGSFACVPA